MATSGDPAYPYTAFNYTVTFDDGGPTGAFNECTGLTNDTEVIEYRTGADSARMRKLPGLTKYSNIVLKRGFLSDDSLWKWREKVLLGKTSSKGEKTRLSGVVTLLSEERAAVLEWHFYEAWPHKLEGPTLNAKNNEVAIETLELAVEWVEFKKLGAA